MGQETWGILDEYEDDFGERRETSPRTRAAILQAMGAAETGEPEAEDEGRIRVVVAGESLPVSGPAEVALEDGTRRAAKKKFPGDLPTGYHDLYVYGEDRPTRLIVTPRRCYLPPVSRLWGWSAQLYALRSQASWGMGDLGDLRALGEWSREQGAGMLLVNPLNAVNPILPQQPSPYFPTSRRYRNPLYLRIEEVVGASEAGADLEALAASGRKLNDGDRIDRDAVFRLKVEALERLWNRFPGSAELDAYRALEGGALRRFATYCALSERFESGWRAWPAEYRRPDSGAVTRFAEENASRVRFHEWVQWLLDEQMKAANAVLPLIVDLPVGVDPDGADAWDLQDVLALDATVGAPPDRYNTQGQDWGLPPFIPQRLRAAAYRPFIEILRAAFRHSGGLRIDHALGLFRLFWIPRGLEPAEGTYVRYPAEELLGVLALESQRAGALVVGEDLGTVDPEMRRELVNRDILSYRLLWFERDRPARYPRRSLAAITTHDLPTVAGLWSGRDLEAQKALELEPNEKGMRAIRKRVETQAEIPDGAPMEEVLRRAHRLLAEAPSLLTAATLEDAAAVVERPNMPGGGAKGRPNWKLPLPMSLERLRVHPLALEIARILDRGRG